MAEARPSYPETHFERVRRGALSVVRIAGGRCLEGWQESDMKVLRLKSQCVPPPCRRQSLRRVECARRQRIDIPADESIEVMED
jgi:hypothetical protein